LGLSHRERVDDDHSDQQQHILKHGSQLCGWRCDAPVYSCMSFRLGYSRMKLTDLIELCVALLLVGILLLQIMLRLLWFLG
jgi:hypothetical protein